MTGKDVTIPQFSTHDPACDYCRIKKIKCDRERPMCTNCKRDEAQCGFSDRTKRVNQTKLLLENVGGLEERLSGLEKTLVSMSHTITEIHKHLFLASLTTRPMAEPMDPNPSLDLGREYLLSGGFLARPDSNLTKLNKPRHVARDLPGLCEELRSSNTLVSGSISGISQTLLLKESVTKLLDELYRVGSTENPICIEPHDSPIHLPPRELLAMACASFFQSEDTPLDIFQHSVFWTNVERIYSSTFSDRDTAWAVSFCLIILLGLCSQQGENGLSTDFSKPYRSTVIRSLGSTTLFLTPKLINLQTLALLSLPDHQFIQPELRETIFDQACNLAKQAVAKNLHLSSDLNSSQDADATVKVLRYLFVRDKSIALFRGKNICLSSAHWTPATYEPSRGTFDEYVQARVALALLQERICLALYSKDAMSRSPTQQAAIFCALDSELHEWHETSTNLLSKQNAASCSLYLAFLSTRVMAFRPSLDFKHKEQVLQDSRSSCEILAADKRTGVMIKATPLHLLAENVSTSVFFSIFNNVIQHSNDDTPADLDLLKEVSLVFQKTYSGIDTYCGKLSRIFQILIAVIDMVKDKDDNGGTHFHNTPKIAEITASAKGNAIPILNLQTHTPDSRTASSGPSIATPTSDQSASPSHERLQSSIRSSKLFDKRSRQTSSPEEVSRSSGSQKRLKASIEPSIVEESPGLLLDLPMSSYSSSDFLNPFPSDHLDVTGTDWDFGIRRDW